MEKKSIFITKNLNEINLFNDFCQKNNFDLETTSFLSFSILPNRLRQACDVYFFSSKKSFDFFNETHNIEVNKKLSCIGKETKNHIENFGYIVDFYSKNAGNPELASKEFKDWLENKRVAFVLSQISYKSISSKIPDEQKEELVLYKTDLIEKKLDETFDYYIFTSPSNVKGFFKNNNCKENSTIIAWGKSTASELIKHVKKIDFTLKESTYDELIKFFNNEINSKSF